MYNGQILIGILISKSPLVHKNTEELIYWKKLCQVGKELGAKVVVFTGKTSQVKTNSIGGWVYNGSWTHGEFPWPDVVYNQISSRRNESSEVVQKVFAYLKSNKIPFFNERYFDKWEIHEALTDSPGIKGLLPESRIFKGLSELKQFVSKYDTVYIKPIKGSLGRGIIKVTSPRTSKYRLTYRVGKQGLNSIEYNTIEDLYNKIKVLVKRGTYIIQQGLNFNNLSGRPFDIRVVMQKDGTGEWRQTKVFARVGAKGGITSNLSSGGMAYPIPEVLRPIYGKDGAATISKEIKKNSRILAGVVEDKMKLHLGEIGIDLGVDRRKRIWLIEVNSKPHKVAVSQRADPTTIRRSLERPLRYCLFLVRKVKKQMLIFKKGF